MRRLTPFALGLYLTGATVVVVLLQLIGGSPPPPHSPSSIGLLRLVIGLPVVLFAPALFVVPQVFRRDAMSIEGGRRTETLDLGWTLLAAMGLNIGFHVVHFNVLRVLGLPITWPALLAITAVECVAGLWWMRRSWGALRFAGPDRSTVRAFAVLIAVGVVFARHQYRGADRQPAAVWPFSRW